MFKFIGFSCPTDFYFVASPYPNSVRKGISPQHGVLEQGRALCYHSKGLALAGDEHIIQPDSSPSFRPWACNALDSLQGPFWGRATTRLLRRVLGRVHRRVLETAFEKVLRKGS